MDEKMYNDIHDISPEAPDSQETPQEPLIEPDNKLTACQAERDAWKEKYMRVQADLDNFSKRTDKERIQWRISAQNMVLQDIIAIIDDFDRAFEQLESQENAADLKNWVTGFKMIHT